MPVIYHKNTMYGGGSGGSGGASAISDLTDVDLTNLSDGQILKYDATNQAWVNDDESGGGGGNANKYSTDEIVIGEWIDGKPIYRKVYDNLNGQYGSTAFNIDVSSLNIDRLIFLDALGSDGAGYTSNKYLITSVTSVNSRNMYLNSNNQIVVSGSYYKHYIIVEYTKTTD